MSLTTIPPFVEEPSAEQSTGAGRGMGIRAFLDEIARDAVLVLAVVALLCTSRLLLLATQHQGIAPTTSAREVAIALLQGLRFDGKIAAHAILPSFLTSLLCLVLDAHGLARWLRRAQVVVFVLLTVLLATIDIFYFREYHAQFDHFVLGAVYDDLGAVLGTVWHSYPVVPALFVAALSTALLTRVVARTVASARWPLARIPAAACGRLARAAWVLGVVLAYLVLLRGRLGTRPVNERDVAVTSDPLLNELVPNAYEALAYALNDWEELASSTGLRVYLPDGDVRAAAARYLGSPEPPANVDAAFERRAPGPLPGVAPARHLILIVMESDSAWTLEERWSALHLADEMKALGREGFLLERFLPASSGTMQTLAALVTGLAEVGVYTNYRASAQAPYPTSIAPIFARLGYRTRLIYGGYLSWQRVGEFAQAQGFDEVHGGGDMDPEAPRNEWGVRDEALYRRAEELIRDDVPSFDLLLTTSNHPPFDVDVWEEGWPVRTIPAGMEQGFEEGRLALRDIGHHAYADACMGRFVRRMAERLDAPVFAVTGDHYSRRFPGARPSLWERTAVPLLLYGPQVLAGRSLPEELVASHHDIVPTLIELAAPAGFRYHAIGRSLFDPARGELAFGPHSRVLGRGWIADLEREWSFEPLPGGSAIDRSPDLTSIRRRFGDFQGLAWWRICEGSSFAEPATSP